MFRVEYARDVALLLYVTMTGLVVTDLMYVVAVKYDRRQDRLN